MPTGTGAFYLYLHGDVRRASRTKVGNLVAVDVEFDTAYRNGPMHPMPAWFRTPLARNRKAAKRMGRAHPEPQEGNSSLLFVAQIAGGTCAQCCARDTRVVGKRGPVHGPIVEKGV